MSKEVVYKNQDDKIITKEEKENLKEYTELTFVSGILKKEERFRVNRKIGPVRHVTYFMDENEDKLDILKQYTSINPQVRFILYLNKQSAWGFDLWDTEQYSIEGRLAFKGKTAFDEKSRPIFYCDFDLETGNLKKNAWKGYYGNKYDVWHQDLLLTFSYHDNGEVEYIVDTNENYGYIKGIPLEDYLSDKSFQELFPWEQHPYYHSVYPFLPEGPL